MLKFPPKQEIKNIYTNHRYRSFSTFLHKKPTNTINNNHLIQLTKSRVLQKSPFHQKTERSIGQLRKSSSQISSSNRKKMSQIIYISPKKGVSERRPQTSMQKNNSAVSFSKSENQRISIPPKNGFQEENLISPCCKNFQYCVNDNDLDKISAKILASDFLLQPCKIKSLSIAQNRNSKSMMEQKIQNKETYNKQLNKNTSLQAESASYFQRRNHRRQPSQSQMAKKILTHTKKDDDIQPWHINEEFDFIKTDSRQM